MARLSILAVLSVALVAMAFGATPVVRTNVIPLKGDCTHEPTNCASGLVCAGHPYKKTCVTPKHPGMQCRIEPFWVCRSELVCENDVCKIPLEGDCSRNTDQCVAGAVCTGSGSSKRCTPVPAKLGDKCDDKVTKCDTGLVCDSDVCKLPRGKRCNDTPDLCASGLNCDGKQTEKRCITYKQPGMGCPADEFFWICQPGLTCEGDVCKIPEGDNCSASPENCVMGSECTGTGSSKTCTPIPAKLGEECNDSTMKCASGLTCDGDVCKLPQGSTCTDSPDQCATGLTCSGSATSKKCVTLQPAGGNCPKDNPLVVCQTGLTCQNELCKIPVGEKCASSPRECVDGAECTGSGSSKTCTPVPAMLGEECDDDANKCATGLVCDSDICKLPRGKRCNATPDLCASGLNCDGKGSEKRCITYKQPGMGCPADELFWICQPGLTCEGDVCKIPEGDNCSASPENCVMGSSCTGSGNSKTCTPIPAKLGEECNDSTMKCESGLTCDGDVCKLPRGETCTDNPTLCVSGLSCAGAGKVKKCITLQPAGEDCGANDFQLCASGLTCQNDFCKIPLGDNCSSSPSNCVSGAECTGSGSSKVCTKVPAMLGEECNDSTMKCARGLTCDRDVCKIPRGEACTDSPTLCASGLSCAGAGKAKQCVTLQPAGEECGKNDFQICQSGLTCEGDVCKIPLGDNCSSSPEDCVDGAECTGSGRSKVCTKVPAMLGEKCDNSSNKCARGLTCDRDVCKLPRGQICTATPTLCASGLSCDGKRSVKRCITYKPAGMRCPSNEDFWICARGLTCQRDVCKVPVGGSCASSPRDCVAGATCSGSGSAKKCAVVPRRAGERCDSTFKCASGLECEGTCKLGRGARCERTPTLCSSKLGCVGIRRKRECQPLVPSGGRCGTIGFRQCQRGLVCYSSRCVRGTVGLRHRCGRGRVCQAGLVCAGTGHRTICVKPMGIGMKCGHEPYWVCAPNARCVHHRCREW